ncbi:MAG: UvrD-helicase domain-containing protein [Flavobacteriales bacterium]
MKINHLDGLNEVQYQAVAKTEGPMMIIAGAGSGKTRVLTHRMVHLMEKGVNAFNILALTFTNKAAREMKERIVQLLGETEIKSLWIGTFHSIFARLLRIEGMYLGYPYNYTIYDQQDAESVIKKVLEYLQLDKELYKPKRVLGWISQYKNNLITVQAYHEDQQLQEKTVASIRPKMGEVYRAYVERCFKAGAMDFDDLLLRTNELFTRFPEILHKYQERFRYILVDEYQDTNHSQYLIVKALASRYRNLCVVGDDAQSIYAFRGANIRNILNFQTDYSDAQIFRLEQNYRSTDHIVQAANSVIAYNRHQIEKKIWTQNESGDKIKIYRAISDDEEGAFVADTLSEFKMREARRNKDFAILYRTNAQSRAMEEALRKRNIPYRIYGGMSFYQYKEIKDLLAYLRLIINPYDEEALLRIINYPVRGLGQITINKLLMMTAVQSKTINELLENLSFYYDQLQFSKGTLAKLQEFMLMIQRFRLKLDEDAYAVAEEVAVISGLVKLFREDNSPDGISRYENVQEFLGSIQSYVEEQRQLEDGNTSLAGFLENIALATDIDKVDSEDTDRVSLMTIHLSKGLEFPIIFIVGLEENLFPSMLSISSQADLEEERRLFYVALTRAQKLVLLSYAVTRYRWGKLIDSEQSRFIEEIDVQCIDRGWAMSDIISHSGLRSSLLDRLSVRGAQKTSVSPFSNLSRKRMKPLQADPSQQENSHATLLSDLREGMKVFHARFGRGEVIDIQARGQDKAVLIRFQRVGEKKLLLRLAKLNIISS